eukprot:Nitzschia sp. Nitz4//scaffold221_size33835//31260//32357//NITZ4_007858-RA/size33835-exonerate_protein2genome-gene-0.18-mRNA-1//1//CDS//3329542578//982//frame0
MAGRPPPYYYPYGAPPPSNSSFQTSSGQLPPPPPPPPLHSAYSAGTTATATPATTHASYQTNPYLPGGYSTLTPPFSYNHALHPTSSVYAQTPAPAPAPVAPPPEPPQEWYCDACELSLTSEQAYKSHRKTHVKCTECSFEGAPKVVKGHYQAVHGKFSGSGFKTVTVSIPGCRVQRFQICVGNRPEDIQRWIADRKRKFPRQQPMAAVGGTNGDPAVSTSAETENKSGMSSLLAGYGSSDSEEEPSKETTNSPRNTTETPVNPASSEVPTSDVAATPARTHTKQRLCRFFARNGTCRNGTNCHFLHEKPSQSSASTPQNDRKRKRGRPTTSDTLLRKLLATDMDREATLTMQLLKHIVEKEFYR